jgi:hypothetical protein
MRQQKERGEERWEMMEREGRDWSRFVGHQKVAFAHHPHIILNIQWYITYHFEEMIAMIL